MRNTEGRHNTIVLVCLSSLFHPIEHFSLVQRNMKMTTAMLNLEVPVMVHINRLPEQKLP